MKRIEVIFRKNSYSIEANPNDTIHEIVSDLFYNIIWPELSLVDRIYCQTQIYFKNYQISYGGQYYSIHDIPKTSQLNLLL